MAMVSYSGAVALRTSENRSSSSSVPNAMLCFENGGCGKPHVNVVVSIVLCHSCDALLIKKCSSLA